METSQYEALNNLIEKYLREKALPALQQFIEIPNLSRSYDPKWNTNGLLEKACQHCVQYAKDMDVKGLTVQMYKDEGKTPLIMGVVEPTRQGKHKNLMVYGHIDKQPHLTEGWREGLGPTTPTIEGNKLYGRGSVDDGYNFYTVIAVIKAFQELGIPHDRFTLFYETDEESDSIDVPYYLKKFEKEIGTPDIMFCLDAGSPSENLFSLATALRGCFTFDLTVQVLDQGIHSGLGSGIVPSSYRIARSLLDRIEDSTTGKMFEALHVQIPEDKLIQAKDAIKIIGDGVFKSFPLHGKTKSMSEDHLEVYLNNVWRSQMEIIGQDGIRRSRNVEMF